MTKEKCIHELDYCLDCDCVFCTECAKGWVQENCDCECHAGELVKV